MLPLPALSFLFSSCRRSGMQAQDSDVTDYDDDALGNAAQEAGGRGCALKLNLLDLAHY